ncbi:MAG: hypothetical protein PF961_18140 [Planctomycetota bacterium]|jgi:hypothetical protein|nr:hypothetical protein [Planctomycetota bacterium]
MKQHITLTAIALATSMLLLSGCYESPRANEYPDHTVNTTRRVKDIKQNAYDQKEAVDIKSDQLSTRMDFDERQIHEKYKVERQALLNEAEGEAASRAARKRDIHSQAEYDKDVIDSELASKMRLISPEEFGAVQAEAARRKTDVDTEAAGKLEPIASDSAQSKIRTSQLILAIDHDESKAISALDQERSRAREATRADKLKIDKWTNDELAKVGYDSESTQR